MKEKSYKIVLGSLYGDEGKGATVQWLCKRELEAGKKPVVVRYSGGAQAAHTVMQKLDNGNTLRHICSSLGSGVLLGVDTYLDEQFLLDPIMLMEELDTLQIELAESGSPLGKDFMPKVWINEWCRIVTPYDIIANRRDLKILSDGTCGKGIFTTCKRYGEAYNMNPLKKVSVKSKDLKVSSIFKDPQAYLDKVREYYGYSRDKSIKELDWDLAKNTKVSSVDELEWKFCNAVNRISVLVSEGKVKLRDEDFRRSGLYDTIIYEGSQGLLLDAKCGFDPYTTSSLVGLNGIPSSVVSSNDPLEAINTEVYLVARTYLTRHGRGAKENHVTYRYGNRLFLSVVDDEHEYNEDNKFQGTFYKAVFDTRLFYRALDRHCIDNYKVTLNLVITHADAIDKYIKNLNADVVEGIKPLVESWIDPITMDEHFPIIDKDGSTKEVVNIHEFKKIICDAADERVRFRDCFYSDNPYSEFKRC